MNLFDPNSYPHLLDDAAMIQAAVDAARESGEKVTIPRHNARTGKDFWDLPRAVKLYSGSCIVLDNCFLRQSDDSTDNIFKNSVCRTPEGTKKENRQYDICIQGIGNATLDGGKYNGICEGNWRTLGIELFGNCLIHFQNVERFVVENITFSNQRYWAMNHHCCSEGHISNIRIKALGDRPNQDGIDLRYGCHSILIENIMGYAGDDVIALTCLNDRDGALMVEGMDSKNWCNCACSFRFRCSHGCSYG
jgi:polygalacturonase